MAMRSFFLIAMLCTAYGAMPADLVGSWTYTTTESDADSSGTSVNCMNVPDLSSGSGTIVQYEAGAGTINACDPSSIGYNQEITRNVIYSAVAGSTTEAELNITKTADTFSDLTTANATCNGETITWADALQTTANEPQTWADALQSLELMPLNQMTSICRTSRDADTLKFSCREGFGGARRRRRVAWSDCPQSAPASSNTATSESECISAHTETLQSATCTKLAQPSSNNAPRSSDSSPFTIVACLLGTLGYIFSQERMTN